METEKFAFVCSPRCRQNLKFGDFTVFLLLVVVVLCEVLPKAALKSFNAARAASSMVPLSANDIISCFVPLSLTCRHHFLNSLLSILRRRVNEERSFRRIS